MSSTVDSSLVLSTLDPETAALVREALSLPAGERLALDAELDATSIAYSDLVADITLWRVVGSPLLYARASDVADALNIERTSISERITDGERRGDLQQRDVIRGATDKDIDGAAMNGIPVDPLTTSPKGCTLLSLDGILLLAMQSRGQRGVALRRKVKAIIDAFPKLQRVCMRLLRAHQEPRPTAAPLDVAAHARDVIAKLASNGAKTIPKAITEAAYGAPRLTATESDTVEPDFGDDFRSSLSRAADLLGCHSKTLRRRLERTEMWTDPAWVQHGMAKVKVGTRLRDEPRHYLHRGALLELQRRERGPMFEA